MLPPRPRGPGPSHRSTRWSYWPTSARDWRSGSPGIDQLRWPMAALGYGFRPHICAAGAGEDTILEGLRTGWLAAVRALFTNHRLVLPHTDPAWASAPVEAPITRRSGPSYWRGPVADSLPAYRQSLARKHRKDLDYYYRRIARGGRSLDRPTPRGSSRAAAGHARCVRPAPPTPGRQGTAASDGRCDGMPHRFRPSLPVGPCRTQRGRRTEAVDPDAPRPTHRGRARSRQRLEKTAARTTAARTTRHWSPASIRLRVPASTSVARCCGIKSSSSFEPDRPVSTCSAVTSATSANSASTLGRPSTWKSSRTARPPGAGGPRSGSSAPSAGRGRSCENSTRNRPAHRPPPEPWNRHRIPLHLRRRRPRTRPRAVNAWWSSLDRTVPRSNRTGNACASSM